MKIYLHIGLPKTGTSAMQMSLHKNREFLRSRAILYPGPEANHAELYFALCDHPHHEHKNIRRGIVTRAAADQWNHRTLERLRSALRQSWQEKAILSAERLCSLSEEGVLRLKQFLEEFSASIVVVCFVRAPVPYARSFAQHDVAAGRTLAASMALPELPEYSVRLGRFIRKFGRDCVRVVNFDEVRSRGESLMAAFCAATDIEPAVANELGIDQVNVSMTQEGALLFDALNRQFPVFVGNRLNLERASIPRGWLEWLGSGEFSMPPEWCQEVFARTRSDVQWLRDTFGVEFGDSMDGAHVPEAPDAVKFSGKLVDDLAKLLHRNAINLETALREVFCLKSKLAEHEGNLTEAIRLLEQSLQWDPHQPVVADRLAALKAESLRGAQAH